MNIFRTNRSKPDLENLEGFLIENRGCKVAEDFDERLERKITLLENGNSVHQRYEGTDFHKLIITKHHCIIYEVTKDQVNLLYMINHFLNPDHNYNLITKKS